MTTDPEYRVEVEDWGSLEEFLTRLESGAETALLDASDDVLLEVAGMLDRLAVGDVDALPEDQRRELAEQLTRIRVSSGSWAHLQGFDRVSVAGTIDAENRERVDALIDRIGAELRQRAETRN